MIEAFRGANTNILAGIHPRSSGRDIRAFVIGGEVVAAMERRGPAGDFRSNLHRGGSARAVEILAGSARPPFGRPARWASMWPASTCCARKGAW
jgi:hypothetical protein